MSYCYQTERQRLFTDDGQRTFLRIRDRANGLLADAGAFAESKAWAGASGDTWLFMACLDRLVELGEIRGLTSPGRSGSFRVFVAVFRDR